MDIVCVAGADRQAEAERGNLTFLLSYLAYAPRLPPLSYLIWKRKRKRRQVQFLGTSLTFPHTTARINQWD